MIFGGAFAKCHPEETTQGGSHPGRLLTAALDQWW